jgi:glycosyltransferase involved in cell wall biosynthesis
VRRPRVAVIGLKGLPGFGGAAVVGQHLLDHMKDEFDFTVYAIASHTSQKRYNGIRQIVLPNFGKGGFNTLLYYVQSMLHCLFLGKYDMIHLHHSESGFIVPLLRLRYRVLTTFHGVYRESDPKFGKLANWLFRFGTQQNLKYADVVTSVSEPDADYCLQKYGANVDYIPNGIDVQESASAQPKSGRITFAAGRIYEIKGLHLLLKAMHEMEHAPALTVIGDTEQVPEYRNKVMELSQGLDVEYVGLIKDREKLFKMISASELFVFPSLTEAMSMMLLEVASVRTPIVASDITANKAVFVEGEVIFFETQNHISLKERLEFALSHPEQMHENAVRAYDRLCSQYTWDSICNRYAQHYRHLIKD